MAKREVAPTDPDKPLYAEDIAKLEGVSLSTAHRRLIALERSHGVEIVGRIPWSGSLLWRRYTTAGALARLKPSQRRHAGEALERVIAAEDEQSALRREIEKLNARVAILEKASSPLVTSRHPAVPLISEGDETSESESSQRTSKRDEVERARRE